MFMTLKPLSERKISADQVIARLRGKLSVVPGATLFIVPAQDLPIGGRQSNSQFPYTRESEHLNDLNTWAPRLLQKLRTLHELTDGSSDQQDRGLQEKVVIDRDTAARLGVSPQDVFFFLNDAAPPDIFSLPHRHFIQY